MKNFYTDEMPDGCYDCPCHNGEHGKCNITGNSIYDKRPFDCPLCPLADCSSDVLIKNISKFDIGQYVWAIDEKNKKVCHEQIKRIQVILPTSYWMDICYFLETGIAYCDEVFATQEEAEFELKIRGFRKLFRTKESLTKFYALMGGKSK